MRAFVCASGESLTQSDCDRVSAWRGPDRIAIAVNLSWRMIPEADILFAGDACFWAHDPYRLEIGAMFHGELWTASQSASRKYKLNLLQRPLRTNSGANAIALAQRLGATWIGLLGFDWGGRHWHEDHPKPLGNCRTFETPEIEKLATELRLKKIEVVNCSRQTGLECFPRQPLEDLHISANS